MPSNRRDRITRRKQKNAIKEAVENKKYKKKVSYISISIVVLIVLAIAITCIQIFNNRNKQLKEQEKQEEVYKIANEKIIIDSVKESDLIRISALGEINLTNNIKISGKPYDKIFEDVSSYYKDRDIIIADTTYEISDENDKSFTQNIKKCGINYLNIANKEIASIEDSEYTLKFLNSMGFNVLGNNEDRVKIVENKGKKIAIISYTMDDTSGKVSFYSEKRAKEDLEKASNEADYNIVLIDWKSGSTLSQNQTVAKYLIDNGANFIIGSNVGEIQRIETIKNKDDEDCIVAYSLGNFTSNGLEKNMELILNFDLYVDENNIILYSVDYVPIYMRDEGADNTENRYKLVDVNKEVKDYEDGNQNIEEGFYQKLKEETKELYKNLSK